MTDRNGRITEVNHPWKNNRFKETGLFGNNVFDVFPLIADKVEDPEKVEALLKEITTKPGKISDEDITFI